MLIEYYKRGDAMKIGMRKPSIKKSISARTTGKAKRAVKKAVIPGYGKKGTGWIKDPKKAAYNKVYNKTTFGVNDITKVSTSSSSSGKSSRRSSGSKAHSSKNSSQKNNKPKWYTRTGWIVLLLILFFPVGCFLMWRYKNDKWNPVVKIAATIVGALWFLSIAFGMNGNDDKSKPPATETVIESIQTKPETESAINTEVYTESPETVAPETEILTTEAPVVETYVTEAYETMAPETEPPEITVYITNTGSKYHRSTCRYLSDSKIETTLSNAIASNYEPCGTCHPPTQ